MNALLKYNWNLNTELSVNFSLTDCWWNHSERIFFFLNLATGEGTLKSVINYNRVGLNIDGNI